MNYKVKSCLFVLSLGYGKALPLHLWGVVLGLAGVLVLEGILGY